MRVKIIDIDKRDAWCIDLDKLRGKTGTFHRECQETPYPFLSGKFYPDEEDLVEVEYIIFHSVKVLPLGGSI